MHVRKGDTVEVISGNYKGTQGRVLKVFKKKQRIIVENVNFVKRATRANPQKNQQGGIREKEAPIHVSNVMLIDPTTKEPTRVINKRLQDGTKVRISKISGEEITIKE